MKCIMYIKFLGNLMSAETYEMYLIIYLFFFFFESNSDVQFDLKCILKIFMVR